MLAKKYIPLAIVLGLFTVSSIGFGTAYGYGSGSTKRVQKFTRTQEQTPKQVTVEVPQQALNVPKGAVRGAERFQFTKDLTDGLTMSDVAELQKRLRAEGFFSHPTDSGYFGPLTRAAVMAYQKAHGITPASGYVGPLTRAELNKLATEEATENEEEVSLSTFIELLITSGVIPADKAEQARTILKEQEAEEA